MFITITDNLNSNILFSGFANPKYHAAMLGHNQTLHENTNKPANKYTYDGDQFIQIEGHSDQIINISDRQLLIEVIRQLRTSGLWISMHASVQDKLHAYQLVNVAASAALERYVSAGKFTPIEYLMVETDILRYRENGSEETEAPETLLSHFDTSDFETIEDAALDIERAVILNRRLIEVTRRTRLTANQAIKAASGDLNSIVEPFIRQLSSI
jgi:hypothetical protein